MLGQDFLLEIGTEELPAKNLKILSDALEQNFKTELSKAALEHGKIKTFATPRRLSILIENLATQQPKQIIEKKGPAVSVAFDTQGQPTAASLGFAKSCNVSIDKLEKRKTDKGEFLYYQTSQSGERTKKILPDIIRNAVYKLPIAKSMRWGDKSEAFIRPVHWLTALFGEDEIIFELFNLKASNKTFGHRFLHPQAINLKKPQEYAKKLATRGKVVADLAERKDKIHQQIHKAAGKKGKVVIDEELLNEVAGLVEWPVAQLCKFDERYLELPSEVLISGMKNHQRYFPIFDENNKLLPYFIVISNIESDNPRNVIAGNEKVMRARLSDAEFFYHADLKHNLDIWLEKLKQVIFQAKLGTMYDKALRITALSQKLAHQFDVNPKDAARTALLAKVDLMSEMVGEFPELQGVMGYYYALKNNEPLAIATGIQEHYLPRFAKDQLPETLIGCLVGIADRIDTIVGIFGINEAPTGEKDPYGLRRAALGLLRIVIEKQLAIDLPILITETIKNYHKNLPNKNIQEEVFTFIMERLRAWYTEQGITADVYAAVMAKSPTKPFDFHLRLLAVQHFCKLPQAQALAAANKRVSNILKKENYISVYSQINPTLFQLPQEQQLEQVLAQKSKRVEELCAHANYTEALVELAELQQPIDDFFDHVMVNVEDEKIRTNRLALLMNLRNLFLLIADISLLQV